MSRLPDDLNLKLKQKISAEKQDGTKMMPLSRNPSANTQDHRELRLIAHPTANASANTSN